ncbi:rCG21644, isoform CRA_b, partial [Rattus norvegicus]
MQVSECGRNPKRVTRQPESRHRERMALLALMLRSVRGQNSVVLAHAKPQDPVKIKQSFKDFLL